MIDINIIKANAKYYSVKCNIIFTDNNEEVTVKIIGLDLVNPISGTSFSKIKSLFHASNPSETLSKLKYPYIYEAITKKLIQKYKMKVLNI